MRTLVKYSTALLVAVVCTQACDGQMVIAEFSEQVVPTNPENGFGFFTFDDFAPPGAVTDGATSLILDVSDSTGSNGVFGGVGVDYLQRDFDPDFAFWELRLKILENNEASAIRTTYRDNDGGDPVGADEHVFEFDLSGVPMDGEFHTLTLPLSNVLFTQRAFGFDANDTLQNPGLNQMQIQSPFDSTGRLHVEVDFARIVTTIPEPSSIALLAVGGLALAGCCRRLR
jgi:hypothetical protein